MTKIKICPGCKEKMLALFTTKGKVSFYSCERCGNLVNAKGKYYIETETYQRQ